MQASFENSISSENFSDDKLTLHSGHVQLDLEFKISKNNEYGTNFDIHTKFSPYGFYKKRLTLEDKLSVLSTYGEFLDSLNEQIKKNNEKILNPELLTEIDKKQISWKREPLEFVKDLVSKTRDFLKEASCIPELLRDIRAVHVTTFVDGEPLVKSTIELDADMCNVISDKLQKNQYQKTFLLHKYNMGFGMFLIQKRIKKFFNAIEPISKLTGVIVSGSYFGFWMFLEASKIINPDFGTVSLGANPVDLMNLLSGIADNDGLTKTIDTVIRMVTQAIGLPALFLKLIPRLSLRILKRALF